MSRKLVVSLIVSVCTVVLGISGIMVGSSIANAASPSTDGYTHGIVNVHQDSLFRENGTINLDVAASLLQVINNTKTAAKGRQQWTSTSAMTAKPIIYGTDGTVDAEDFSNANKGHFASVSVLLKLFPTAGGGDLNSFGAQRWQMVYLYENNQTDASVLTLMMTNGYTSGEFNTTANADYSKSTVRTKIKNDYESTLSNMAQGGIVSVEELKDYFTSAQVWQGQQYQTGTAKNGSYWKSAAADSYGSSGYLKETLYAVNNGLDGTTSALTAHFGTAVDNAAGDKIWLPSSFEVHYMGQDKENIDTVTAEKTARGGLFRLNQYDRDEFFWTRSARSNNTSDVIVNATGGGVAAAVPTVTVTAPTVMYSNVCPIVHINLDALYSEKEMYSRRTETASTDNDNSFVSTDGLGGNLQPLTDTVIKENMPFTNISPYETNVKTVSFDAGTGNIIKSIRFNTDPNQSNIGEIIAINNNTPANFNRIGYVWYQAYYTSSKQYITIKIYGMENVTAHVTIVKQPAS